MTKKPAQGWLIFLLNLKPNKLAERTGLEPATPGVTGRPCLNREQPAELSSSDDKKPAQGWLIFLLNLKPSKMAERTGLEPATPSVTGRDHFQKCP
jgi:hypothetical protein